MSGPSPPIDIATPSRNRLSASPRNQASNLTSALQRAGPTSSTLSGTTPRNINDPPRPIFGRQDSMGLGLGSSTSAARPISGAGKIRRESNVGSFMGGMSWGGISVGSWVQDDIMMGGTSPYNFQSPSYHSSSYLPKMEANFWNNLKCCDTTFTDLHQLLSHFEEVHSQAPSTFPYRMSGSGSGNWPRRKSSPMGGFSNQSDSLRPTNQTRGFQPVSDSKLNGMHSNQTPHPPRDDFHKASTSTLQDMDTFGDMELDSTDTQVFEQDLTSYDEQADEYSPDPSSRPTPQTMSSTDSIHLQNQQFSSNPATPRPAYQTFPGQNNPMVSSVNTPTFGGNQQQQQMNMETPTFGQPMMQADPDPTLAVGQYPSNTMPFNSHMLQRLNNDFGSMDFGNNGNDMLDLCINEPAKALYSENGAFNTQQFPHFNFTSNIPTSNGDENARKLQAHRLASGVGKMPGEEERPFKCPVIGCEKAYKNANGLRYHEKHGHSTQKLKDNGDGSFSIVDPLTEIPYPGTVGMEKEKPYRCEVCGKRYKNLNGLKYHRNHSPPCNPEFSLGGIQNGGIGAMGTPEAEVF